MNAPQKITGFVLGLVVVFAAAFGVGATVGPDNAAGAADHSMPSERPAAAAYPTAGLSATENGYILELTETRADPVMADDGTWSVPVDLSAGDALTLGADLHVAGRYEPQSLPPAAATAKVDGYTVSLNRDATANDTSTLTFPVARNGKPVTDLQPYLGAYGHLVALRASDLAYLHPMAEPGDGTTHAGPEITVGTTIPSGGDYRLFLDFKHENVVRTAEFTLSVDGGSPR
jgi:hypothetical protein